jgi:CrcB protein
VITFLLTALAGGLGAAARYALDTGLSGRVRAGWLRLLVINVSGSVLLGLLAGLAAGRLVSPEASAILGAGFLGGYTTFSAASLVAVGLVEQQRWAPALGASVGMLLGASAAAALGLLVGLSL